VDQLDVGLPAVNVAVNVPEAPDPVGVTDANPTFADDGLVTRMLTAVPVIDPEPAVTEPLTVNVPVPDTLEGLIALMVIESPAESVPVAKTTNGEANKNAMSIPAAIAGSSFIGATA
jgi:hypothetical protein